MTMLAEILNYVESLVLHSTQQPLSSSAVVDEMRRIRRYWTTDRALEFFDVIQRATIKELAEYMLRMG
jgi:hypothetical protein